MKPKETHGLELSTKMQDTVAVTIDNESGNVIPLPRQPRLLRLATVKEVRLELARLYRDARAGRIPPADAAKFAFLLDRIRVCIVDHELEARVAELEKLGSR
jgi:hypothetical protein